MVKCQLSGSDDCHIMVCKFRHSLPVYENIIGQKGRGSYFGRPFLEGEGFRNHFLSHTKGVNRSKNKNLRQSEGRLLGCLSLDRPSLRFHPPGLPEVWPRNWPELRHPMCCLLGGSGLCFHSTENFHREKGVSKWPSLPTAIPPRTKANLQHIQILLPRHNKRSATHHKWWKPEFAGGALTLAGRFEAGALANALARFSACLR